MRGEKKLVARGKTASGIACRHPVRREFARDAARYVTAQRSAKPSKPGVRFQGLSQIDDSHSDWKLAGHKKACRRLK